MIRKPFFALVAVLAVAASAQAAVIVTSDAGTPTTGLTGFTTFHLTATSDVPGEFISVVDFIGDPSNHDPATGRGFFGPMNQINPIGMKTVFNDLNGFMVAPANPAQDSQFSETSTNVTVPDPTTFTVEGPAILQAIYSYGNPQSLTLPLAQLALPDAANGHVNYRGVFSVTRGGTIVDLPEISGCVGLPGQCGGGGTAPVVGDLDLGMLTDPTQLPMVMGTVPLTPGTPDAGNFSLGGFMYTPNYGAAAGAPGILNQPTFDPLTGKFVWDARGSTRGDYKWVVTGTNSIGTDTGMITAAQKVVPEPATFALCGLAMVGLVGMLRKR